jgi:hypothetical protein
LSPPGAPLTPTAPIVSLPILLCGQRTGTARQVMLGELIDPVSGSKGQQGDKAKDILGRVYE